MKNMAEGNLSNTLGNIVERTLSDAYVEIAGKSSNDEKGDECASNGDLIVFDSVRDFEVEKLDESNNKIEEVGAFQDDSNQEAKLMSMNELPYEREHIGTESEKIDEKVNKDVFKLVTYSDYEASGESEGTDELSFVRKGATAENSLNKDDTNNLVENCTDLSCNGTDVECKNDKVTSSTPISAIKSDTLLCHDPPKATKKLIMDDVLSNNKLSSNLAVMIGDISGIENGAYSDGPIESNDGSKLEGNQDVPIGNEKTETLMPSTLDLSDLETGSVGSYKDFSLQEKAKRHRIAISVLWIVQNNALLNQVLNGRKYCKKKEQTTSVTSENLTARDSSKLKMQKEQLLAEELRIQEQLRKLKEEQQRLVASKEEEERIARERFLKQQQLEREEMIREQQKQIMALKKMQEHQEATFRKAMKRTGKLREQPHLPSKSKQSDPRLPKEDSKPEKLVVEARGLKAEKKDLLGDAKTMAENHAIEEQKEEPVAKKIKSDDEVQESSKSEEILGSFNKFSRAIDSNEKVGSETVSSTADVVPEKEEHSVALSHKMGVKETISSSSENENYPEAKNPKTTGKLQKDLESGEISKDGLNAIVSQLPTPYNGARSNESRGEDHHATGSIAVSVHNIPSVAQQDDRKQESHTTFQVISDRAGNKPLEETSNSQKLLEPTAVIAIKEEPAETPVDAYREPAYVAPMEVPSATVVSEEQKSVILDSRKDQNQLLSSRDSESSALKTALPASQSNDVGEVMDSQFRGEKRRIWSGGRRKLDEEKMRNDRFGSTKGFNPEFDQRAINEKDMLSRDTPIEQPFHKERHPELPRAIPRSNEERHQRPEFMRNEKQVSSRQRHPRGRGGSFRGRGNRVTPPLDPAQIPQPNENLTDSRLKRPPWRRPMERPGTRRPSRPYRGIDNGRGNERPPRENRPMNFYAERPPFNGPLPGTSGGPPRRMMRHPFDNERHHESREEAFSAPQRPEHRYHDDVMYRNPHFDEPRNIHLDENYYHESDFYDPRTKHLEGRERLPIPERDIGRFEYDARNFNQGYNRTHFHNENDMPLSMEEDPLPPPDMRFPPNERFLRKDEDNRSYDERNIPRDSEHLSDRFNVRDDGFLRLNQHSYILYNTQDDDQYGNVYQDPAKKQFEDNVLPNNLESTVIQREEQNSYEFDYRSTGKTEQFLKVGNLDGSNEAIPNRIVSENTSRSTNPSSVMDMIRNIKQGSESITKKEEPPSDTDSSQSQGQRAPSGIKKIFEGLVSAGFLPTSMFNDEPAPSPPPNIETSEDDIPSIGFVMEQLKTRHDSVINKLYSGTQCGTCGLRFTPNDRKFYRDHLDWHFRNNRIGRDGKKSASRTWYHSKEIWMDMDDVTDFEEQAKSAVFELERKIQDPVASEGSKSCSVLREDEVCNICFEPFEQFWDEPLEEWRYNDAMRINGEAYHVNCYDDLKTGNSSDQEVSGDEIEDSFTKESENLSTSLSRLSPELSRVDQNNVLPNDVDKSEIAKMSQNGKLLGEESHDIVSENTENNKDSLKSPKSLKELCSASNLSDNLKVKDENEVT